MKRGVTIETELPSSREEVWRALTDPVALSEWLMPVEGFAPVVGQRFVLRAKPMPGWDGVVNCEVLEVDEPGRLAYRWQGSRMSRSTTVTWQLTGMEGGRTRLRLEHDGFDGVGGSLFAMMHRGGWKKFLHNRLPSHLAG